jgi:hypothetical protein
MAFCTTCGASVNGAFCPQCGTSIGAAAAPPPAYGAQPNMAPPVYAQPYGAPPPAAGPRKTSPLVWVLVIILGLFFLGFASCAAVGLFVAHKAKQAGLDPSLLQSNPGLAISKLIAATNPNVEVVKSDDAAGTITVRDKTTGKVSTITFDQARNGQFSISADDDKGGKATMQFGGAANNSDLPSWVPRYPGSEGKSTFAIKGSSADLEEGGSFTFTTPDPNDKVIDFYKAKAQDLGLKVKMTTVTGTTSMFSAAEDGDKRSIMVIVGDQNGSRSVSVTYGAKK